MGDAALCSCPVALWLMLRSVQGRETVWEEKEAPGASGTRLGALSLGGQLFSSGGISVVDQFAHGRGRSSGLSRWLTGEVGGSLIN